MFGPTRLDRIRAALHLDPLPRAVEYNDYSWTQPRVEALCNASNRGDIGARNELGRYYRWLLGHGRHNQ